MYLTLPNEEQMETARKEIGATKESMQSDVQHLIEWMAKQPHLPNITDEHLLEHCLLNCKNSLEKTKNRLDSYFTMKANMPEVFRHRDPFSKEIERVNSLGMYIPLPKLTNDGYRVIIMYMSEKANTNEPSPFSHFLKSSFMTVDVIGKYDYPRGVIVVHDGQNMTMSFVTTAATELHKLILLSTKAIPVRYRHLYFINMGPASEIFLSVGKQLVKKELAKRIQILKNGDLTQVLPAEIVPRDYGGTEVPMETLKSMWCEEVKNHKEYLSTTEKYFSDLSRNSGGAYNSELFGLDGSFRKINVD